MNGRTPTKAEKDWLEQIVQIGCIVCRTNGKHTPPQVHHIEGSRKEGAHFLTIPLCYYHHQEGSDCEAYTSFHPYRARFKKRYGTENFLLQKTKDMIKENLNGKI